MLAFVPASTPSLSGAIRSLALVLSGRNPVSVVTLRFRLPPISASRQASKPTTSAATPSPRERPSEPEPEAAGVVLVWPVVAVVAGAFDVVSVRTGAG